MTETLFISFKTNVKLYYLKF